MKQSGDMLCTGVAAYDYNRQRSMTRMAMSKERKGVCTFTFCIESSMTGVSNLSTTYDTCENARDRDTAKDHSLLWVPHLHLLVVDHVES
jgi:hypothetical protein